MESKNEFYVYSHHRASNGELFYIGKGKGPRINSPSGRNKHWHNVVSKNGIESRKVLENMPEPCAFTLEKILIYIHKEKLVNRSIGGEGNSGVVHTEETKEKFRKAKIGKPQKPEHAQKSRIAKVGKKQPQSARDFTRKIKSKPVINSDGEVFRSVTYAAECMRMRKGSRTSQSNISQSALGNRPQASGYTWSYDITKTPKLMPLPIMGRDIICLENGMEFGSVQLAVKWVKGFRNSAHNQCISKAAREGSVAYGYHWKYKV